LGKVVRVEGEIALEIESMVVVEVICSPEKGFQVVVAVVWMLAQAFPGDFVLGVVIWLQEQVFLNVLALVFEAISVQILAIVVVAVLGVIWLQEQVFLAGIVKSDSLLVENLEPDLQVH